MGENKKDVSGYVTWLVRLSVGLTFVFSGFVKAIDPWGFLYKTEEYLSVISISIWPNLLLVGVFALCAIEFLIGIFLLFGCFRQSVAIMALALMCIMLPLTAWIAIWDPIKDCGCFGDAFKISNWVSFWKNVVLTAGAIWLFKNNKATICLVTPALQWLALIVTGSYIVTIEIFGYTSQPLLDFRSYKVGTRLIEGNTYENLEPQFVFVYEKNGVTKEFGEEDVLPEEESGWKFVDRIEINPATDNKEKAEADRNFRVWSENGEEDVTAEVISDNGKELLVMMPDLRDVSPATTWKINSLFEWSVSHGVRMIGVVAGSRNEIESWKDISMASYPIYLADDTQIKEVVRGNPGIVFIENGEIGWKSTLSALNIDDFMQPDISDDARNFGLDNSRILRNLTYLFIIIMMSLVVMSFLPKLKELYIKDTDGKTESTHDDKVHP